MKFLLSAISVFLLNISVLAEEADIALQSSEYDFASVNEGDVLKTELNIVNTGSSDLLIERIIPDCGCILIGEIKNPIKPATELKIPVEFKTSGLNGNQLRSLIIYSNDPDERAVKFYLTGNIKALIEVNPQVVSLVSPGEKAVSLTVKSEAFELNDLQTRSKFINLEINKKTKNEINASISLTSAATAGDFQQKLILSTSDSKNPIKYIPVRISKKSDLQFEPTVLSAGILDLRKEFIVDLKSITGKSFIIKSARSKSDAVEVSFDSNLAASSHKIKILINPEKVVNDLRSVVQVQTDDSTNPDLILSIYGVKPELK